MTKEEKFNLDQLIHKPKPTLTEVMEQIAEENQGADFLRVKTHSVLKGFGYHELGRFMVKFDGCGDLVGVYERRKESEIYYSLPSTEQTYLSWLSTVSKK